MNDTVGDGAPVPNREDWFSYHLRLHFVEIAHPLWARFGMILAPFHPQGMAEAMDYTDELAEFSRPLRDFSGGA